MPATISESYLSRPWTIGRNPGRELIYDVFGTSDEEAVRSLLASVAPPAYLGLRLERFGADPEWVDTLTDDGHWKARAGYAGFENDDEFTFDTGGETVKITQSIATIAAVGVAGSTPPDYLGAIGVTEDSVEGVEITIPTYQFSETHRIASTLVTDSYKAQLMLLTGSVNDSVFRSHAAGECLFLGAAGTKRGDEDWNITYRFSCKGNQTGLEIGELDPIDKRGWDYLWIVYGHFEDATAHAIIRKPIYAYVEQVYFYRDLSGLGI